MGRRALAETVTGIIAAFWKEKTWSQSALAKELDLSPRAVAKHLSELLLAGWPLTRDEDHPHVYWSVPPSWFPEGVLLEQRDVAALLHVLLRVPESNERKRLLRLVAARLPAPAGGAMDRVVPPSTSDDSERNLPALLDAAVGRESLRVKYFGASRGDVRDRVVSVQRVVVGPPARLVVWCHASKKLKWFRVDGVLQADHDKTEVFHQVPDDDVDAFLRASVDGYAAGPVIRVEAFVREPECRWVERNLPAGVEARADDGGILLFAETAGVVPFARFIVGLGAAAECRSSELAAAVRVLAEGAIAGARQS
jgi:predicted DNA-binding transcriptional regulator YafY